MIDHAEAAAADEAAIAAILTIAGVAARNGWVPATSGNFSARVKGGRIAITRSGVHKAALLPGDVVFVDLNAPLPAGVSAETPLHLARYAADPSIGMVAHVHSVVSTVLSRAAGDAQSITLRGYEMQKAFPGVASHEGGVDIAVFPNRQEMGPLAAEIEARFAALPVPLPGYVLAGHGLYAWGRDARETQRHLEAFEFLLACEIEERRIR